MRSCASRLARTRRRWYVGLSRRRSWGGFGEVPQPAGRAVADGAAEQLPAVRADGQVPVGDHGVDRTVYDADKIFVLQLRGDDHPVDEGRCQLTRSPRHVALLRPRRGPSVRHAEAFER
jgi:hypothetical protein